MENRNSRRYRHVRQPIDGFVRRETRPVYIAASRQKPKTISSRPAKPAAEPVRSHRYVPNRITSADMELPSRGRQERRKPRAKHYVKRHRLRRWVFGTSGVAVVGILLIGGYLFSKGYLQLHKVFTGGSSAVALNSDVKPALLKGEGSGRVNVLLLGIGGPGHPGSDLTDTIIVASVDVVNHKIGLLSIPRDMWVKEPNNYMSQFGKLNAAYESGKYKYLGRIVSNNDNIKAIKAGFQTVDQTISKIAGIPIHYNVLVNFHAFEQGVNAVGGIRVDVPEEVYDPTMAWQNNWSPIIAKKGEQKMDGYHALLYARSRETSSDFARSSRQRLILLALKSKILSAGTLSNPIKINNLMDALGDNVRTDISLTDMERLYDIVSKIPSSRIQSVDLDKPPHDLVTTGTMAGQSIVHPKAGLFDYSAIQSYVRNTLRDGYLAKENALVKVLNGTSIVGLAGQETDRLKSYGYNVAEPGDMPAGSSWQQTTLIDLSRGRDKYTKHYLEQRLGVKASTELPTGVSVGAADFVIILGQDEASNN